MLITVLSQNLQFGAAADGRLPGLYDIVREAKPDLVLLQEADDLGDPEIREQAAEAMGMEIELAPSLNLPVAVAWNPRVLTKTGVETKYWNVMHHGYCAVRFEIPGLATPLPVPLVVISTHLTPYSADLAAGEASLLAARLYRFGGAGILAGDINHCTFDDPEPDWTQVPPYNRASRCLRRLGDEPWRSNRVVGQTLRDADLTDVAAYLAEGRGDMTLRAPTGKAGLVRVDQAHVTPALVPTIRDYRTLESDLSDHHGLIATFALDAFDASRVLQYT